MTTPPVLEPDLTSDEGLRARKKRETLARIEAAALERFLADGYEATTVEEIAADAGIARRTFFTYFPSKEAILLAFMGGGLAKSLRAHMLAQSREQSPLAAVRSSMLELFPARDTDRALAIFKLLEATEALRARRQAVSLELEQSTFETLCEMWPEPEMRARLRMVAVISIGAMRVAKDAWRHDEGRYPLAKYLEESFAALEEAV